jgi:hypothetical protein
MHFIRGMSGIRRNGLNDIFVAGAFGEFLHFNELSWKSYINEVERVQCDYGGVSVKNNHVTVGYENQPSKNANG